MVSVIIPVYNTEQYLHQCVESVRRQTLRDLEIILVDDGSTDGSGAICDEFAQKDSRIQVIHKKNGGSTSARNAGLRASHGEYIGFVDSDDWIESVMYEEMLSAAERAQADIVLSARYISRESGEYEEPMCVPAGIYQKSAPSMDILLRNLIYVEDYSGKGITPNLWDKLFRRELLYQHQFRIDHRIRNGEDDASVYPCLLHADKILAMDRAYYHYRMREDSVSHSADERYFENVTLLYQHLQSAFHEHPMALILMKQLKCYTLEWILRGINRFFGFGFGMVIPFYLPPYRLLKENRLERIVLYGAGEVGQGYRRWFEITQVVETTAWVDRQWEDYRRKGLPVGPLSGIRELTYDGILIAVDNVGLAEQIRRSLIDFGIPEEKIFYERPQKLVQTIREAT